MLVGLEKDAIIFTNGDNDTFPLWYIQDVEGYRTDVRVVNLSLLNTPWYIEQCRDNEPKVPISWSNEQIERLSPVPVKNGWLLVRDLAVQHILQTNRFQRPIYFAVTIPPSTYAPYRKYMEMEGLVYKVVPREGDNMINVTRLEKNIWENFKYDGILTADWKRDHSIYLPDYTEHLIQNYAAAFVQLSYIQHQDSSYADAVRSMEVAGQISPNMEPPRQLLGLYYLDAGDTAKAVAYYLDRLRAQPGDVQLMYRLGGVYERIGEYGKALDLLDAILAEDPEDRDLTVTAYSIAVKADMLDRARRYLSVWVSGHPSDASAQKMLEELDGRIRATPEKAPGQ
jgi:tetratricopeptide (TPR) repeat protein